MKKFVCLFLLALVGCGSNSDSESKFNATSVVNGTIIDLIPHDLSLEQWKSHIKKHFNYTTILGVWENSGFYIAIGIKDDILDIITVSPEKMGEKQTKFPNINILNKNNEFITDIEKTIEYRKNNQIPIIFYKNNIILGINRMLLNKEMAYNEVLVKIEIIGGNEKSINQAIPFEN